MKLSFSTRGWQLLGWEELLESAEESGMNGIELYDLHKRLDLIIFPCIIALIYRYFICTLLAA